MAIYWIPYLYFFLLSGFAKLKQSALRNALIMIGATWLFAVAALRNDVDNDFESYKYLFELIDPININSNYFDRDYLVYFEPGFFYLVSVLKLVSSNLEFATTAFLSIAIWAYVFFKYSAYPAVSFFLYTCFSFYLHEFTQIRFGLAIAIGFLGLCLWREGIKKRALLLFALSTTFHYAAVFFFVAPLWAKFTASKRFIIGLAVFVLGLYAFNVFGSVMDRLIAIGGLDSRLEFYSNNDDDAASVSPILIILNFIILIYMVVVKKKEDKNLYFESIYLLSFSFLCLFSQFDIMRRLSMLFNPAIYIIVPDLIKDRKLFYAYPVFGLYTIIFISRLDILRPYAI